MGFLSAYSGTQKVTVGDPARGYWVEIREYVSQGDKTKAEQVLQGRQRVNGSDVVMDMDVAGYRQLMVVASIVSWNLDDDNGRVWPINLQSVRQLPGPEFDRIWKVVDELNAPASSGERRQFPDSRDGGDPVGSTGGEQPAVTGDVLAGATALATPGYAPGGPGEASVA